MNWEQLRLETDREERTALITGLTIKEVRFPNQNEDKVMYKSNRNQARTVPGSSARNNARFSAMSNRSQNGGASGRSNNVYADKNGNIYRQTDLG